MRMLLPGEQRGLRVAEGVAQKLQVLGGDNPGSPVLPVRRARNDGNIKDFGGAVFQTRDCAPGMEPAGDERHASVGVPAQERCQCLHFAVCIAECTGDNLDGGGGIKGCIPGAVPLFQCVDAPLGTRQVALVVVLRKVITMPVLAVQPPLQEILLWNIAALMLGVLFFLVRWAQRQQDNIPSQNAVK